MDFINFFVFFKFKFVILWIIFKIVIFLFEGYLVRIVLNFVCFFFGFVVVVLGVFGIVIGIIILLVGVVVLILKVFLICFINLDVFSRESVLSCLRILLVFVDIINFLFVVS